MNWRFIEAGNCPNKTLVSVAMPMLICCVTSAFAAEVEKPAAKAPDYRAAKGTLYLVGGAADSCLRRFATLAGGEHGLVAIVAHASEEPAKYADDMANKLKSFGVDNTVPILPGGKGVLPNGVTAVIIIGGDQNRLTRTMDKELADAIGLYYMDGGLVAGTSAGTAAASVNMIAGGMGEDLPKGGALRMGKGLGYKPGTIFDTHVDAYVRFLRCLAALALTGEEDFCAVGLDENTALEIKDGKARVHGTGLVRVHRRAANFASKLSTIPDGQLASISNVLISVYPAGEEFALP